MRADTGIVKVDDRRPGAPHLPWDCKDNACDCLKREVQRLQTKVGLDDLSRKDLIALVDVYGGALVRKVAKGALGTSLQFSEAG